MEIFPIPGDAYCMDAGVQGGYVHVMLKTKQSLIQGGRWMGIIFQNGITQSQLSDNGQDIKNLGARQGLEYFFDGNKFCNSKWPLDGRIIQKFEEMASHRCMDFRILTRENRI